MQRAVHCGRLKLIGNWDKSMQADSVAADHADSQRTMKALLMPDSVAILGCSGDLDRINGRPLKYLLENGYKGHIFPVNPKHERIAGLRCYPNVAAIPEAVDLAIIALPAALVVGAVRELVAKGVPAAVIFSSGFAEIGEEGAAAQRELVEVARAGGLRFCGPNVVGLFNAFEGMTASFSEYLEGSVAPGPVGFVSQSGAFGTAIAVLARQRQLGLGYYINTGNEADIDIGDAFKFIIEDPRIRVVAGYVEGVRDGKKLLAAAERAMALGKPIILTKVGRSNAGARAAASHTGALAGADAVLDGILRQKGIIRAEDEQQMIDLVEAFVHCALPQGPNLGIVSQSGGAGVLACDRAEMLGLQVPTLAAETQMKLKKVLPGYSAVANPVDVTGASLTKPELMGEAMKLLLSDPGIDIGVLWLRLMEGSVDVVVDIITDIKESTSKPFLVSWLAAPKSALVALRERGICVTGGAVQAIDSIAGLVRYSSAQRRRIIDSKAHARGPDRTLPRFEGIRAGTGIVPTMTAAEILSRAGVPLVPTESARDVGAACAAAARLGYPLAVKIESPDIPHKTEAGGVRLGIANEHELCEAFEQIGRSALAYKSSARIDGVIVQSMAEPGVEMVIGVHQDAAFGPVVMVGLGGILVEALKDVAFAAAPLTKSEAEAMISGLRGGRVLEGVRGRSPIDRARLCDLLVAVSRLAAAEGGRLAELDLNPVIATSSAAVAADWLMVLSDRSPNAR